MERKFRITVDGKEYSVTVEDLSEGDAMILPGPGSMTIPTPRPAAPLSAPAVGKDPVGAGDVISTLGGVVDSIVVSVGQPVNQGDKVIFVEAMKMKTPMVAHRAGKVASIAVKIGDAVEAGQVVLTIS